MAEQVQVNTNPEEKVIITETGKPVSDNNTPGTPQQPIKYAGFFQRLVAVIIDSFLVGFVVGFMGMVFGVYKDGNTNYFNPFEIVAIIYPIFMLVKYRATFGKMAMGIRVQNETTGANLTWIEAILRETVGKFLSGIVFLLGYIWMLWDSKKQTWHDKIAKSVVVKTK